MTDALRMLPPLVLLGTLWGVTPVFVKYLGGIGWPPLMIAVFGAMGSAVILVTLCRLRGLSIPLDGRHLRYYAVSGLFGMALRTSSASPACSTSRPASSPCSCRSPP